MSKLKEKYLQGATFEVVPLFGESQGEEHFRVKFADGQEKTIRSWEYAEIYSIPGLYQKLYCDLLDYRCFLELGNLLLKYAFPKFQDLRVLDLACGCGLMGQYLKAKSPLEVETLVGVDILPEAIMALNRDYPGTYDDSFAVREGLNQELEDRFTFNCLTICGGASHLELADFKRYVGLLDEGAYIVFNLLIESQDGRREKILHWMEEDLIFCESKIYNHRKLANGNIVQHEAFLFEKGNMG